MNSTAPSSSAFAQTGWNLGFAKSSPATLPPIWAPRRPSFFTASSSCCTARSGNCRASDAKAAKRSGCDAHSSASFSFCILTIAAAVSRSLRYQNGLMESTSMSIAIASICLRRSATTMYWFSAPLTGTNTLGASSPIRLTASWKRQCECTSMVLTRLSLTMTGRRRPGSCARAASSIPQLQKAMPAAPAPLRKPLRVVIPFPPGIVVATLRKPAAFRRDCWPVRAIDQAAFDLRPPLRRFEICALKAYTCDPFLSSWRALSRTPASLNLQGFEDAGAGDKRGHDDHNKKWLRDPDKAIQGRGDGRTFAIQEHHASQGPAGCGEIQGVQQACP